MILHDPGFKVTHHDYGIMLPISPSRADRIVEALAPPPGFMLDMAAAVRALNLPAGPVLARQDLERVHSKNYVAALYGDGPGGKQSLLDALLAAWELIDERGRPNRYEPDRAARPLEELFGKILTQAGGTYLACRLALARRAGTAAESAGFCYYLGGGMHHARYGSGTGFCLINDIMIAARKLHAEKRAELIWVVDVDAHKGCGTAELIRLARERGELSTDGVDLRITNDGSGQCFHAGSPQIFSLSIHMARGWPLDAETLAKARPGHAPLVPADVEIPVDSGGEKCYISALEAGLRKLRQLSESYAQHRSSGKWKPDLVIVVDGADPYEHDGLASSSPIKLSLAQCLDRDRLVYDHLRRENIPSAWILAGGYGERAWEPVAAFLAECILA
ncbi:MAG: histone deacetylase [Treponema sp.]|jgi:acetoin utilization deacetylase AcuC-like enzyme|nr:histone deacetylase [Treponema sp.]